MVMIKLLASIILSLNVFQSEFAATDYSTTQQTH